MFQSILGLFVFSGIAVLLSENRKKISARLIISAISLQLVLGVVTLKFAWIRQGFFYLNSLVTAISKATGEGTAMVFGYIGGGALPYPGILSRGVVYSCVSIVALDFSDERTVCVVVLLENHPCHGAFFQCDSQ